MKLESLEDYYEARDVPHCAQGDIYAEIPFTHATVPPEAFQAAGARKRPTGGETAQAVLINLVAPGIVLHYTCGITAQPPGTVGYAHEFRLLAPIVSLRTLKANFGMKNNELRKVRDGSTIQGFMYLPQTTGLVLDDPADPEDEWSGHAAALIFRPGVVSQAVLDNRQRLLQLSGPATQILDAYIIHTYTPNDFDPSSLAEADVSNGWEPPAVSA